MRKRTKIIFALAVACAGTLVLGACADEGPYRELKEEDNACVQIRYEANGGLFDQRANTSVVNVYKLEDVQKGIVIYAPDDDENIDKDASTIARGGYFLAGWYSVREPRVNEKGEPLDEDGNVCNVEKTVVDEKGEPVLDLEGKEQTVLLSVNGKEQSYTYSNRWDFEGKKKLTLNDVKETDDGYALTLYAGWIPEFTYRVNMEVDGKWQVVATKTFNPLERPELESIGVPTWDETTGKMDYGEFPEAKLEKEGKAVALTFEAVYADKEKSKPLTEITHSRSYNRENGTATEEELYIDYYADYREGLWFRIHTAQQLADNARTDGCYEILEDLDFVDKDGKPVIWPNAFKGSFSGTIVGIDAEGNETVRKISNVTVTESGTSSSYGGLFGKINADARIENVNFENATFHLQKGTRTPVAQFGLFAGELNSTAKIKNVTVSGTFKFGLEPEGEDGIPNDFIVNSKNSFHILTGNGVTEGINEGNKYGNIVVESLLDTLEVTCEVDEKGNLSGEITVQKVDPKEEDKKDASSGQQ